MINTTARMLDADQLIEDDPNLDLMILDEFEVIDSTDGYT